MCINKIYLLELHSEQRLTKSHAALLSTSVIVDSLVILHEYLVNYLIQQFCIKS